MLFLIGLLTLMTNLNEPIQKLNPSLPDSRVSMISSVIVSRAPKYGFKTHEEFYLILAMIKKESNFYHIYGSHGEVGALQVIPEDSHIMKLVSEISCNDDEQYCKNGRPDVFVNKEIASYKVRRFISKHHHYALEAGIGEMRYWYNRYQTSLKRKYWTKYPNWYFKTNIENYDLRRDKINWWWTNLVAKSGDLVWISHYNWGERVSTATSSCNYALQVISILETII